MRQNIKTLCFLSAALLCAAMTTEEIIFQQPSELSQILPEEHTDGTFIDYSQQTIEQQSQSEQSNSQHFDLSPESLQQRLLATVTSSNNLTTIKKAHSIALFIIWGILVDISIICVRYFKAYKKYLRLHASIMALANVCSLIVIFVQIGDRATQISNLSNQSSKEGAHFILGVIILSLIVLQHFLGMVTKLNFENENGSQTVYSFKLVHKVLGYFIYLVAKANVVVGADLFEKTYYIKTNTDDYWWAKAIGGLYVAEGIILVSIEFLYRQEPIFLTKQTPVKAEYLDLTQQETYNKILERYNDHRSVEEINAEFPDITYVVYENSVFDISEIQHPGGQFLLKYIKGKEISRYFNGGYSCEYTTMSPYRHTLYALNFLRTFFIGDIRSEEYNIFARQDEPEVKEQQGQQLKSQLKGDGSAALEGQQAQQQQLKDGDQQEKPKPQAQPSQGQRKQPQQQQQQPSQQLFFRNQNQQGKAVWNLSEVRNVNEFYKVFLFTNPAYKVRTSMPGVRWFGRSVVLTPQIDTVNIHPRNYSVVLGFLEENYRYRLDLIKYFQNKMRDDIAQSQVSVATGRQNITAPVHVPFSQSFPLLIKEQQGTTVTNGLSKFLHLNVHKLYYLSEPVGQGLEIDENSDGEHIIFAAGTGILPFLDLFDFLLKKLIYEIIKDRFGQDEANTVNPTNQNYDTTFGQNFKIKLFCAFTSKAQAYGYQTICDLHNFSREFQQNPMFQATLRFGNQESDQFLPSTKQNFDLQFIDLALSQSFPTKILICGPPEFNKNIANILIHTRKIEPQRVQIV